MQLRREEFRSLFNKEQKKDKLFNDLIELVVELKLKWRSPRTDCTPFLKKLTNLLWYIDGHHGTIAEKSSAIPDIFSPFQGYNCPEVSKHRKRAKDNLKREELESYSLFLQEAIHASWMQPFKEFRSSVEGLRDSLCGYTSYLLSKSKYQRLHHLMKFKSHPLIQRIIQLLDISAECITPLTNCNH